MSNEKKFKLKESNNPELMNEIWFDFSSMSILAVLAMMADIVVEKNGGSKEDIIKPMISSWETSAQEKINFICESSNKPDHIKDIMKKEYMREFDILKLYINEIMIDLGINLK